MKPLDYAKKCCDTLMRKFPDGNLPPVNKMSYHGGVFLSGMERTYLQCGDKKYDDYIKKWVNNYISEDGEITGVNTGTLDDIQPSNLLLRYYQTQGIEGYKIALDKLVPLFLTWKCNSKGGCWHKMCYPNQMWLDGFYMAGPIAVKYGILTGNRDYIVFAHKQLMLMWENMRDEQTGLLYHAWDESRKTPWANPVTGCSPEFWGRAMGWYVVAASDISELLPDSEPLKKDFTDCAVHLIKAIVKFQDKNSGMWFQVIDKGHMSDNWLETSCSCLFAYSLANLIRRGLLDDSYVSHANMAYNGILHQAIHEDNGDLIIKNVCIGTGVGDYTHYINRPVVENDLHGVGAFVLMCTEYQKMENLKL